jgi:predicted  nucleic acid-binding Zn-ribbon protein
MVWMTSVVAFGTLCLAVAGVFQYLTIREQGKTAAQQLVVIKEQSNVMRDQLTEIHDQANSLRQQTLTLTDSLTETQRLVRQNDQGVKAAQDQARASILSITAALASVKLSEENKALAERSLLVSTRAFVMVQSVEDY